MSSLVRWDPFAELSALQKQFFGDDWLTPFKGISLSTTDVYTKDNQLKIETVMPPKMCDFVAFLTAPGMQ